MDRHRASSRRAALCCVLGVLCVATLAGCAAAPEVKPTYEALERGFRWQCEDAPDPQVCVHHKFLALQERRARQLTLNECAVTYGFVARARQGEGCRNAPEPETIECRTLLGSMTCTIADDTK